MPPEGEPPIELGDYVTIGAPRRGALTWQVEDICLDLALGSREPLASTALLISGTTGRRRWEPTEKLHRFTPKENTP